MKIKKTETKEVENPSIKIEYYFGGNNIRIELHWTCPKCSGWGCGRHGSHDICDNTQKISTLSELKESFGFEAAEDFKEKVLKFLNG